MKRQREEEKEEISEREVKKIKLDKKRKRSCLEEENNYSVKKIKREEIISKRDILLYL
jgi:hypothetical protein